MERERAREREKERERYIDIETETETSRETGGNTVVAGLCRVAVVSITSDVLGSRHSSYGYAYIPTAFAASESCSCYSCCEEKLAAEH